MQNGYATQLRPPRAILASHLPDRQSDINSIHSSNSFTGYRRPGHFRRDLGARLRPELDSPTTSSASSSFAQGVGYLSGRAIEWTGKQILSGIHSADCYWRLWRCRQLVAQWKKTPMSQVEQWVSTWAELINYHLDELLDLSQPHHGLEVQRVALGISGQWDNLWGRYLDLDRDTEFWLLRVKSIPLSYLRDRVKGADGISSKMREILLQEHIGHIDLHRSFSEIVICACDELMYSQSSVSRSVAFYMLYWLSGLPEPRKQLGRLGMQGGILVHVAQKLMNSNDIGPMELAHATHFFTVHARKLPHFRDVVYHLARSLILHLRTMDLPNNPHWESIAVYCGAISELAYHSSSIHILCDVDVCNLLAQIIVHHQHAGRPEHYIDCNIIYTFHQLSKLEQEGVAAMVYDAIIGTGGINVLCSLTQGGVQWDRGWMKVDIQRHLAKLLDPVRMIQHAGRSSMETDEGSGEEEGTGSEDQ